MTSRIILLVEDNPNDEALTLRALMKSGDLPKIGGLEAVRRIRENAETKLLPVVILTSSDEEEDRLHGYEVGANSYVRKPVEFNKFAAAVQQLGLYWILLNETSPPNRRNRSLDATKTPDPVA
jgi:two-component system, response regulator